VMAGKPSLLQRAMFVVSERLYERSGFKNFAGLGGAGQTIYGAPGFTLPGANYDYNRAAGLRYDNSVVMACVGFLTRVWSEAPMVVANKTFDGKQYHLETVPNHALENIIKFPNPYYDGHTLWLGTLLSFVVDGNAYWYKLYSRSGKLAGFIYLPHMYVDPSNEKDNPSGNELVTGYWYNNPSGNRVWIKKDRIVHFRHGIDPECMGRGLSPLKACLREICTDNEAGTYAAAILRNMGVPGALLAPKNVLPRQESRDQRKRLKTQWNETFRGEGRGSVMVAPFPIEVLDIAINPESLMLDKMVEHPVSRICAAVGLDPMVMGFHSSNKTYSNYKEAFEAAYRTCIMPMKQAFADQLTAQMLRVEFKEEATEVSWDYTGVWALERDIDKLWERVTKAFVGGVIKRSEGKNILGQPVDPAKDDVYYTDLVAANTAKDQTVKDPNPSKMFDEPMPPKQVPMESQE